MRIMNASSIAWREVLVRADDLETLMEWVCTLPGAKALDSPLGRGASREIETARELSKQPRPLTRRLSGGDVHSAQRFLDAAYVNILRLSPPDYINGILENLLVDASQHLPPDDTRRAQLQQLITRGPGALSEHDRHTVVATVQATQAAAHLELGRVRNFRTVIVGVSVATALLAAVIGVLGFVGPGALPLCFDPTEQLVVCPFEDSNAFVDSEGAKAAALREGASPYDAMLVLFVGLLGAGISAAAGLRRMNASHDPYSLQVTLAVLKLPLGAVTAFLGILFLRAEFVPGLSALDSSAQIIGWAIVFGYAQQLFTRVVDNQAASLLAQASSTAEPARRPSTASARGPMVAPVTP